MCTGLDQEPTDAQKHKSTDHLVDNRPAQKFAGAYGDANDCHGEPEKNLHAGRYDAEFAQKSK
jgi:hypothetical protein